MTSLQPEIFLKKPMTSLQPEILGGENRFEISFNVIVALFRGEKKCRLMVVIIILLKKF